VAKTDEESVGFQFLASCGLHESTTQRCHELNRRRVDVRLLSVVALLVEIDASSESHMDIIEY